MTSALDRLKAAAGKNAPAAGTTPTPTPVTPAATAPAAAATAPAAETPAPTATKAVSTTVSTSAPIKDASEAKNVLADLWGKTTEEVEAGSLFDEMNSGGMAHTLPFAQIKNKNWSVDKKLDPNIAEFMPSGDKAFTMVYLGYRFGYTIWPITDVVAGKQAKPDGRPPIARGVIPSSRMLANSTDITRRMLGIGSKVQYKKLKPDVLKSKGLGKLTPETHILGWTPDTGFLILSCPGFKTSELTSAQLVDENIRSCVGVAPLAFKLLVNETINKKVDPAADNAKWSDAYVQPEAQPNSKRTQEYLEAWEAFSNANVQDVATVVRNFMAGADYNGESIENTEKYLARYENCPV